MLECAIEEVAVGTAKKKVRVLKFKMKKQRKNVSCLPLSVFQELKRPRGDSDQIRSEVKVLLDKTQVLRRCSLKGRYDSCTLDLNL